MGKINKLRLPILFAALVLSLSIGQNLYSEIRTDPVRNRANNCMKAIEAQDDGKKLVVKKIDTGKNTSLKEARFLLEAQTQEHTVDVLNWDVFNYRPKVGFRIGHTGTEIWLEYYVSEKSIRGVVARTNGSVHEDSCVEFFLSLDHVNYYNFEINCIGTKHVAYGPDRNNRKNIDPKILDAVRVDPSLGNQPFEERTGSYNWKLLVIIPVSCFVYSDIKKLDGVKATANFYKCGDKTSPPHYLSWNPVHTKTPDYHRPEYFGQIYFD
ncbi:hypothetical protein AQPE_0290 [Aquipluma nitroreducens]|uniref:Carbohydrate-binding domain-containing protein n=2 Tax=Aquipluma nitroreducens TaxID=2010828 RepID=A0A5K7S3N0_9BACT|nr:hypothetical protein AQPE_0290 [Aquipluma nitroreducens]